jgi:hypothetical protein
MNTNFFILKTEFIPSGYILLCLLVSVSNRMSFNVKGIYDVIRFVFKSARVQNTCQPKK